MAFRQFASVETPCVLLDKSKLQDNIRRIQKIADTHHVNVRPHIKTHKCLEIFQLQEDVGAVGITASKTDEALTFINNGVQSVTVAYPLVVESKLNRLITASCLHQVDLRLTLDSFYGLEVIAQVAKRHGKQIGVFLKIDVGLRRCGIVEDDPLILKLATAIQEESILNFLGLLSHAGHAYGAENRDHVWKISKNEHQILSRVRQKLEAVQIEVKEISVGSTPTILASDTYATITEIRPGNYVFMDRTPLRLGLIQPQEIALSILATVVSVNPECFIIDAGSKVLSSDQGAHGIAGMEGYGLVYPLDCFEDFGHEMIISKLSEEHGFVARRNFDLPIGSVVRIKPNHSCSVANLANFYVVSNGDKIIDKWKIDARGQVS